MVIIRRWHQMVSSVCDDWCSRSSLLYCGKETHRYEYPNVNQHALLQCPAKLFTACGHRFSACADPSLGNERTSENSHRWLELPARIEATRSRCSHLHWILSCCNTLTTVTKHNLYLFALFLALPLSFKRLLLPLERMRLHCICMISYRKSVKSWILQHRLPICS